MKNNNDGTAVALTRPPLAPSRETDIPDYLQRVYWWAYLHPNAVRLFEREWLVNLILWGNFARLRDAALAEFGDHIVADDTKLCRAESDKGGDIEAAHPNQPEVGPGGRKRQRPAVLVEQGGVRRNAGALQQRQGFGKDAAFGQGEDDRPGIGHG